MMKFNISLPFTFGFKITLILLSGLCFYFGNSLQGNNGWLIWIAPVPILYISLIVKPGQAFIFAFIAYLIGRLSWLSYLIIVLPLPLAILFTLILPLIFALIVIAARRIVLILPYWFSSLAFPIFFTAFEYILFIFSKDGTASSIAYTQCNYLPVIQIASITGILGISFLITFVPAALSLFIFLKQKKKSVGMLTGLIILVISVSFIYGFVRLSKPNLGNTVLIGMATIDEVAYKGIYQNDTSKEIQLTDLYLREVSKLADQGVKIVLLPEKAIIVRDINIDLILQEFRRLAINRNIRIIVGVTKQKTGYYFNNTWVISDQGKLIADYQKVNLFEGEVLDGCRPGNKIEIFREDSLNEGVAICKDLDFQQYILNYSRKNPAVLYVPAWDFIKDGWLHSRMAIMRSVEGGFAMARNARLGRLTINNWRGEIIAEANSESGAHTSLMGTLTLSNHPTIYSKTGDWFGLSNLLIGIGLIIFIVLISLFRPRIPFNI